MASVYIYITMTYKQKFDETTISVPFRDLIGLDETAFKTHETTSGVRLLQLASKDISMQGVKLIRLDKLGNKGEGEAIISLTSKILGKRYYEFLNVDTVPYALDRINSLGFINVGSLRNSDALLLHPAKDVLLSNPGPRLLQLLKLLHVNARYRMTEFKNENSLTYDKNVKTRRCKEHTKIYRKDLEFEMDKNRDFRDSLAPSDLATMRLHARDRLRLEDEKKSKTKIRQCYKTTNLLEILHSPINPLSQMLDKLMMDMATRTELSEERLFLVGLTEKEAQIFGVCAMFKHSLEQINDYYYHRYAHRRATASKKFKEAKHLISRYRAQQGNLNDSDFALLKEFTTVVALDI